MLHNTAAFKFSHKFLHLEVHTHSLQTSLNVTDGSLVCDLGTNIYSICNHPQSSGSWMTTFYIPSFHNHPL